MERPTRLTTPIVTVSQGLTSAVRRCCMDHMPTTNDERARELADRPIRYDSELASKAYDALMEYTTVTLSPGINVPAGGNVGTWMPSPLVLVAFTDNKISTYLRDKATGDFVCTAVIDMSDPADNVAP